VIALVALARLHFGRIPRKLLALSLAGLVILFVITPLYRSNLRDVGLEPSVALEDAAGKVGRALLDTPFTVVGGGIDAIYSRLRNVDSLAVLVARTPADIPYRTVESVPTNVAAALAQRFIWPEKPPAAHGYYFNIEYLQRSP